MVWSEKFTLGDKGKLTLQDDGSVVRALIEYDDFGDPENPESVQIAVAFTINGVRESWSSYYVYNQPGQQQVLGRYLRNTQVISFHMADTGTEKLGGAFDYTFPIYRGGDKPFVNIRQGSVIKRAVPYVKVAGVWRSAEVYAKHSGKWKRTN